MPQLPYGVEGTVLYNGSAYRGAKISVRDTTEGTRPAPVDDKTIVYTNASGRYTINLANSTSAFAVGDAIRVYCQVGNILSYSDTTTTPAGFSTVNFTIVRKSGLVDGIKSTPLASGKGTLNRQLVKGCKDGMS